MQTTAFPLSKRHRRSYRLGAAYRWRVVQFQAQVGTVVTNCRLLVAYNAAKEQFRATLAIELGQDMSVIASYEFHGTHPGWHMHAACGSVESIPAGSLRRAWQKRVPPPRSLHRRTSFSVSGDQAALELAATFFRLHKHAGSLL